MFQKGVNSFRDTFNKNALPKLNLLKRKISTLVYKNLFKKITNVKVNIKNLFSQIQRLIHSYQCRLRQDAFETQLKSLEDEDKNFLAKFQELKKKCGPGKFLKITNCVICCHFGSYMEFDITES